MYMLRSLSRRTKKYDMHVYTSFFQPLIRRKQFRELTSEVGEQDVGETPRRRNDC